jgi:hypothetical protein
MRVGLKRRTTILYTGCVPKDSRIAFVPPSSVALLIVAILSLAVGCTRKEPVVVVDDWWNVDYAKNGCATRAVTEEPCVGDPATEVRSFEVQLGTVFASDPSCHGVVLANYKGPDSTPSKSASTADWQLMFDFISGEVSQNWSMVGHVDGTYNTGNGNPKEIAHTICAVVKQTGGSVVN